MNEITFNLTNNPWINNGLVRLIYELKNNENFNLEITKNSTSIQITSDNNLLNYISEIFQYLASDGTYNFSQVIKKNNLEMEDIDIKPSVIFPKEKTDCKKKVIVPSKNGGSKKEQEWKQRLSYLSNSKVYLSFLDFSSHGLYHNFANEKTYNKLCMNCGEYTDVLEDSKPSINPWNGEHQNNEDEGVDTSKGGRKKIKLCKKCLLLSYISLFDKHIPFYNSNQKTYLILPGVNDLNILYKIINNLSNPTQYINFKDSNIIKYNTNIKEYKSGIMSLAIITILHNIKNRYSKEITSNTNTFLQFNDNEMMKLEDWVLFEKDTYNFYRISSNNKLYKILEPNYYKDEKKYLLTDFLNKLYFKNEVMANKFYNSILLLNYKNFSNSLFEISKNYNNIGGTSNFYIFIQIFFDQIMDVMLMLSEETKESCKEIAGSIGKSFFKDVGLLSKFAYVTNKDDFKEILSEATFLMAKRSILNNENPYLNNNTLEKFWNQLDDENFDELKSYFIAFMSANVIYSNYKKNDGGK